MSYDETIEELQKAVAEKQKELEELQITANQLCKLADRPALYVIGDQKKNEKPQEQRLKGDEYYGKALATVITEILSKRKASDIGPARVDEIFNCMKAGGYVFNVDQPLRAIAISMGKNPKFTKLPNEKWGLSDWYPFAKERKVANRASGQDTTEPEVKSPQQKPKE